MRIYSFSSHSHIGDMVICTGAVRNVCLVHPEIKFAIPAYCGEVYRNNPDFTDIGNGMFYTPLPKITYGSLEQEKHGANGTVVEAYTKSLCALLGIPQVPCATPTPVICLTDGEMEAAKKWEGKILLNANCQTCSRSKGYPHWQQVVDLLRDRYEFVQIGGNENRDLSPDISGVIDMRGKTTLRDLFAMAYGCMGVMSPPSGITNISAAWRKPQIVMNASREPDILTAYPNTVHVSRKFRCGWGRDTGCVFCRCGGGSRACFDFITDETGREWCSCQNEITPDEVAEKAVGLFG